MYSSTNSQSSAKNESLSIFKGGGEMGALMRQYDWASHPLGDPSQWPLSLQANIRLMLNSGFPMFIWWTKEFYMFNNDAYIPALGKKHPESLGAKSKEVWSEIWPQIGGIAEGIMQDGNEFYAENLQLYLGRKGFSEETYWTFSYSPAFDDTGEVAGVFCACSEVTDMVLGQRRLKTLRDVSDALTQASSLEQAGQAACDVFQQNPHDLPFSLIYLLNSTGTAVQRVGAAGEVAASLAPEQITLSQSDSPWPFAQVQQTQQKVVVDFAGDTADIHMARQAAVFPFFNVGHDKVIGFLISGISPNLEYNEAYKGFHALLAGQIATSITGVQSRQEIIRQQEYLNEIFQQAPVGITMLRGPEYIVDIANPGICEIWGRKQEDVLRRPVLEAIPEAYDQVKQLLDGVMQTGVPFVADELPIVLERNGVMETLHLNFVYHPMRDAQGHISGIIAVATDISEQVRARQEIETINNELLATNADLDNFVYSASHDLRAPISNIEGLVHELQANLPPEVTSSADIQQLITYMQNAIERFKGVVGDLTQVAKIQREAGEDVSEINLADVVREVSLDFEPIIAASGARVVTSFAENSNIRFSSKNARSIVYNLISNALKYKSPDRQPHISISTRYEANSLVLSVADNGLGVYPQDVRKMFSMFKRLHDHVEGSGIGLYIVKKIVENAGGKIDVDSTLHEGTTLKVYFKQEISDPSSITG